VILRTRAVRERERERGLIWGVRSLGRYTIEMGSNEAMRALFHSWNRDPKQQNIGYS
jgi:hypothetical protein